MSPPIKKTPSEKACAQALKKFSDRLGAIKASPVRTGQRPGTWSYYRAIADDICSLCALLRDIDSVIASGSVPAKCVIQKDDADDFKREIRTLRDVVRKYQRKLESAQRKEDDSDDAADEAEFGHHSPPPSPPTIDRCPTKPAAALCPHLTALGISIDHMPSLATVKAAFNALALVTHPDKGGSSEAFRAIRDALNALVDALR